jgi:hypothetical protein
MAQVRSEMGDGDLFRLMKLLISVWRRSSLTAELRTEGLPSKACPTSVP